MNYTELNSNDLLSRIAGPFQAAALMERYQSLSALARADENELMQIPGVGEAKAAAIKSAFSLAQKMSHEVTAVPPLLDTPDKIADLLREEFRLQTVETLYVVLLNTRCRLIKYHKISNGTLNTLLVHPREVFRSAIVANAASLTLAHQHPSGCCDPSPEDIRITRDLIRAGQLLKIEVLDHVIMGERTTERPQDWISLRAQGYFYV